VASTDAVAVADAGKPGTDRSDAAEDLEGHEMDAGVGTLTPVECCMAAENRAAGSPQGEPLADYN